jgi:hypothetical protein
MFPIELKAKHAPEPNPRSDVGILGGARARARISHA